MPDRSFDRLVQGFLLKTGVPPVLPGGTPVFQDYVLSYSETGSLVSSSGTSSPLKMAS